MQLDNNLFLKMTSEERAATELDIYLLGGQANAAGAAAIGDADDSIRDRSVYENIRYCSRRPVGSGVYEQWDESCGPVKEGLGFEKEYIGPELGMAQVMNEAYAAPNKKALIIKSAARGISLEFDDGENARHVPTNNAMERFLERGSWYPFENGADSPFKPSGMMLRNLLSFTEKLYKELKELGFGKIRFSAMVWMQGEDDRNAKRSADYPMYFEELKRRIRTCVSDLTGEDYSDLPFILGEISESFHTPAPEKVEMCRHFIEVQHSLADTDKNVHVVPTGKLQLTKYEGDEIVFLGTTQWHWNYKDMLTVGRLFGEACLKYGK